MLRTIARLYRTYKPLSFFGVLAFLFLLIATLFFIPVFIEYLSTGQVDKFPTLIVCGFTVIAAIQSFFAGLILASLRPVPIFNNYIFNLHIFINRVDAHLCFNFKSLRQYRECFNKVIAECPITSHNIFDIAFKQ